MCCRGPESSLIMPICRMWERKQAEAGRRDHLQALWRQVRCFPFPCGICFSFVCFLALFLDYMFIFISTEPFRPLAERKLLHCRILYKKRTQRVVQYDAR